MRCSICKKANYCNRDCQKAHWKQHKSSCSTSFAPGAHKIATLMEQPSAPTIHLGALVIVNPVPRTDHGNTDSKTARAPYEAQVVAIHRDEKFVDVTVPSMAPIESLQWQFSDYPRASPSMRAEADPDASANEQIQGT